MRPSINLAQSIPGLYGISTGWGPMYVVTGHLKAFAPEIAREIQLEPGTEYRLGDYERETGDVNEIQLQNGQVLIVDRRERERRSALVAIVDGAFFGDEPVTAPKPVAQALIDGAYFQYQPEPPYPQPAAQRQVAFAPIVQNHYPRAQVPAPSPPIVTALEAEQPGGSFGKAFLTRDELRELSLEEHEWSLAETQFWLASMAHTNYTTPFRSTQLVTLFDASNIAQLLPVHDPKINQTNKGFVANKGRNYVLGRIVSAARGRVVHEGEAACVQCQKAVIQGWSRKRYCQCVTAADGQRNAVFGGACSNCAHNDHPGQCSFYQG